jgi:uncharacterized membrane protein
MAVIAFGAALFIAKKSGPTFVIGFAAVFIAWIILALIKSIPNDNLLADRVAHMMQLPNWIELLLVTALIGGLVGGMAALSGFLFKKAIK